MKGAGGTQGGIGRFILGLAMLIGGGYLFFDSIRIGFHWGYGLYRVGGFNLTGGMVLIPFVFGVALIFFSAKNPFGWILAGGSLLALAFGVLRSIRFHMGNLSAFDLILILVLLFGGLGLFISSLKDAARES